MMKRSSDVEIEEKIEFDSLLQNQALLKGLGRSGYEQPSPVQLKVIPLGRLGIDLIAQAKSGTGKTVVFGVLTIEAINTAIKYPQAIILAPTREIAIQIRDVIRDLSYFIPNLKCHAFIGGLSIQADCQNLIGCQVMIGTPGRLMALLEAKKIHLDHIKLFVLDEADKMMSESFTPQVNYIFSKLKKKVFQSVAFSATFTNDLLNQLSHFLKNPQIIRLTEGVPTLKEVQQYYSIINADENESNLNIYRKKFEKVQDILSQTSYYQCMVFVNSIYRAIELSNWLNEMGWKSGYIHATISQEKRLLAMEQMREFKIRILVCSDLIARGIDIDKVNLVINLDLPWEIETYLHRIGRTGRFGTSGIAISLIGPSDQTFLEKLHDQDIQIEPLPDKISHNEYVKQLTEEERETLTKHETLIIQSKPIKLNQPEIEPKRKKSKQKQQTSKHHRKLQMNYDNHSGYDNYPDYHAYPNYDNHPSYDNYPSYDDYPKYSNYPNNYNHHGYENDRDYHSSDTHRQKRDNRQLTHPFVPPDLFF